MKQTKKKRVLIIDQSEHYRSFLKKQLLARNYEIAGEAEDGEQAIKLFESRKPDLTLLNFEMVDTTGIGILQEILTQNPDARIVMLAEGSDINTMNLCLDNGALHCIGKYYPLETIFSAIEESLKLTAVIEG